MKKYEIVANEVKYSLRDRWSEESGLLEYMKREKIALIAYTPLEKGSRGTPAWPRLEENTEKHRHRSRSTT